MPDWWYREKRPQTDDDYFENMCRVIFQAGLNWQVIDNKWPTTRKAFANFNIDKVACFTDDDVERLMKDAESSETKPKSKQSYTMHKGFKAIEKNISVHSKHT